MRVHVVANPTAGRGRVPRLEAAVEARLRAAGAVVTVYRTTAPGDAVAHVAALPADACDRLAVIGGDGTVHEVVNGKPPPLPWPVAVVPVGTANLVARDAGMPLTKDADRIARAVLGGTPWTVDLLSTDRGYVVATAGAGLDAAVVRAVHSARAGGIGGYAKWVRPIGETFVGYQPPELTVVVDGGPPLHGGAAIVQNTNCYGGLFTLHPDARMDDGRLEVAVLVEAHRRDFFRMLYGAWRGRLARDKGVRLLAGTSVEIRSSGPCPVQADGDPAGDTPFSARIVPKALTLIRGAPARALPYSR